MGSACSSGGERSREDREPSSVGQEMSYGTIGDRGFSSQKLPISIEKQDTPPPRKRRGSAAGRGSAARLLASTQTSTHRKAADEWRESRDNTLIPETLRMDVANAAISAVSQLSIDQHICRQRTQQLKQGLEQMGDDADVCAG